MIMSRKVRDESVPEVAATVSDAAAQILSHSFAVYRVDAATATNIRAAHRTAVKFFHEGTRAGCDCRNSNNNNNEAFVEQFQRIVNGNLYGYNIPLQSKELFRTWHHPRFSIGSKRNDDEDKTEEETEDEYFFRHQQPWPSNEFCIQSFRVAKDLHRLLSECVQQIIAMTLDHRFDTNAGKYDDEKSPSKSIQDHLRRRRKPTFIDHPAPKRCRTSSSDDPIDIEKRQEKKKTEIDWPDFRSASCPLDYFFYHNRIPHATNCSEHVDRGALVVVCLTDAPGLEVCATAGAASSSSRPWFQCPEVLVHNENLYKKERTKDSCCSDLVCIMAGDQLSRLLTPQNNHDYQQISPCIHRVRNPLKRARVSISYELRFDDP